MSDLNKKYQEIIKMLEANIKDEKIRNLIIEKISELNFEYIDSAETLSEMERFQHRIENKMRNLERRIENIEDDIYVVPDEDDFLGDKMHDNDYEFEITCPYCEYNFLTDESFTKFDEIKCPNCHREIALDWSSEKCGDGCSHCHGICYSEENDEGVKEQDHSIAEKDEKFKNDKNNKKKKDDNKDDDM